MRGGIELESPSDATALSALEEAPLYSGVMLRQVRKRLKPQMDPMDTDGWRPRRAQCAEASPVQVP